MNLLITNDLSAYGAASITRTDMVIVVSNNGKSFTIFKNRHGFTSNGEELPISVLPQVIAKPDGRIVVEWK
jgi:hypothetical protein